MKYHYTECGLDNVYIYNVPMLTDIKGEKTICIPKINLLHKAISEGIIRKNGLINAKEIRFLRTELGYTQAQFSELLGKEAQACGRWEREEVNIDKTTDSLIRIEVANYLNIQIKLGDVSALNSSTTKKNNINIDGLNNQYKLMAA